MGGKNVASPVCPTSNATTPGTSALAVLAASMPAGTWAKLGALNQDAMLGVGSISGTMIHYCNSMPWNAKARAIEILAMDHNYGRLRYVRYNEATNQFQLMADDVGLGSATQHGYDHVNVNPATGDLYYRQFSVNTGAIRCFKKAYASTASFSALPTLAADGGAEQASIGTCWWSGPFTGAGAQGSLVVFNSGNALSAPTDGQMAAYNPLTNAWFFSQNSFAPNYGSGATYNSLMQYSEKKNVAVYGGGNVAPNKLWRLNADRSFVAMPDVPAGKAVGMQHGLLIEEPVTGNFLLLSAGELWELNPSGAGTWTKQTGARVPPSGVGIPGPDPTITAMVCTAIADHGVVAFITQPNQGGGTMFLYKHA